MIVLLNQYVSTRSIAMMLFETFVLGLAVVIGSWLRFWSDPQSFWEFLGTSAFAIEAIVVVSCFQICLFYGKLYSVQRSVKCSERIAAMLQWVGVGCLLLAVLYTFFPTLLVADGTLLLAVLISLLSLGSTRTVLYPFWTASPRQNVLILGTGPLASTVAREIRRREDLGLQIIGFLSADDQFVPTDGSEVIGKDDDLERIAVECQVSRVVLAMDHQPHWTPSRSLVRLRMSGVKMEDAQSAMCALSGRILLETLQPSWFFFSKGFDRPRTMLIGKRLIDILVGAAGLVLASPLMLLIAAAIGLESDGPALYRQTRVGLRGRHFRIWKFRSMRKNAEKAGAQWARENDSRVTMVGKYLRRYRLDELPQLWNILKGEMSFVGPRPERPEFVEQFRASIQYYDERHLIKPGLTGWAQVRYSYGSSFDDAMWKLEYDLFYLKHMSLLLDAVIFAQTIRIVATGKGAR